jgi:dihydropyrimidine dehydrogenase (NAD+) subunit PreT
LRPIRSSRPSVKTSLTLAAQLGLKTKKGFIDVDANFQTNVAGIYAIGDCIRSTGVASTVMAVQDGKLAAEAIHQQLASSAPVEVK